MSLSDEAILCVQKLNKPRYFSKPGSLSDRAAKWDGLLRRIQDRLVQPRNLR